MLRNQARSLKAGPALRSALSRFGWRLSHCAGLGRGRAGGVPDPLPTSLKGFSQGSTGSCLRTGRAERNRDLRRTVRSSVRKPFSSSIRGRVGNCFMASCVILLSTKKMRLHTKNLTEFFTVFAADDASQVPFSSADCDPDDGGSGKTYVLPEGDWKLYRVRKRGFGSGLVPL